MTGSLVRLRKTLKPRTKGSKRVKQKREVNPPLPSKPQPEPINPGQQFLSDFSDKIFTRIAEMQSAQDRKMELLEMNSRQRLFTIW